MRNRSSKLMAVLTIASLAVLIWSATLPSFVLHVTLKNDTNSKLSVVSILAGTSQIAATSVDPGTEKRFKVFSGDGNQASMVFVIVATKADGTIIHTSRHRGFDRRTAPLITIREAETTSHPTTRQDSE